MSGDDTDSIGLRITLRDVYREQQEMKSLLEKLANNLEMRVGWAVGSFGLLAALAPFFAKIIP